MFFHNTPCNGQAKARASGFGGEIGIKNLLQRIFGYTRAVVPDFYFAVRVAAAGQNPHAPSRGTGLQGVQDDVQHRPFPLLRVEHELHPFCMKIAYQPDFPRFRVLLKQAQTFPEQGIHLHRLPFQFGFPRQRQKAGDNLCEPVRFFTDRAQGFLRGMRFPVQQVQGMP
ncbi:MAG: hypothetical protein BWX80_03699 [Candidatus Hydrogenedentes bacterium ADurb.Bin101]|nr:MAG: hypothetical protein BWX80_03699 [Candidatus Hydrogenedentes bacterium ADurb.Bin101]